MNDDEKKCPRCAETIKKEAHVCRFCGLGKPEPSERPQKVFSAPPKISFQSCMGCVGIVIAGLFVLTLLPSSKTDSPSADTLPVVTSSASPPPDHPTFAVGDEDVLSIIRKAGEPWNVETILDTSDFTASVNLRRRALIFAHGSVDIDTTPDGKVAAVTIRTGSFGDCGNAAPLGKVFGDLVSGLHLSVPTSDQVDQMKEAWRSRTNAEIDVDRLKIYASGDCVPVLRLKATTQ